MKRPLSSSNGSALIVMGAVMFSVICLIGFGLLATRQAWRENSSKLLGQAVANQDLYSASSGLRASITRQFSTTSMISRGNVPIPPFGTSFDGKKLFDFSADSDLTLNAIQGGAPLLSLTDANDPLYGLKAKTDVLRYRQFGRLRGESALGNRAMRDQAAEVKVEIRQFPLSQFSQFHSVDSSVSGANLATLGRAHSNGSLTLAATCTALYPLTVAGQLTFAPGASVAVRQSPAAERSYGAGSATTVGTRRVLMQNTVVDQDVVQSTISMAATLAQMVSPPHVDLGTAAKNAQKLCTRCDVVVFYDSSNKTFTATTQANIPDLQTTAAMGTYNGVLQTEEGGHPIIELDVTRLEAEGSRWTSYYVYSDVPQAIVMIRNGEILPRELSIVTPHDVWIDVAFNTPSDAKKVKPASIVTGGRLIGVDG